MTTTARTDETRRAVEAALKELAMCIAYDGIHDPANPNDFSPAVARYTDEVMTILAAQEIRP